MPKTLICWSAYWSESGLPTILQVEGRYYSLRSAIIGSTLEARRPYCAGQPRHEAEKNGSSKENARVARVRLYPFRNDLV